MYRLALFQDAAHRTCHRPARLRLEIHRRGALDIVHAIVSMDDVIPWTAGNLNPQSDELRKEWEGLDHSEGRNRDRPAQDLGQSVLLREARVT